MGLTISSPVSGVVRPLADVADYVFSQLVMGPGLAIEPSEGSRRVLSPVDGVILSLHPHAFVIESVDARAILVHLGLDTIEMRGRGFTPHTSVGEVVARGDLLLEWSPGAVVEAGHDPIVPIVALQAPAPGPSPLTPAGAAIGAGDPLMTWD
jgi:PTS system N-acetylglucosamine-specific IIA component